jgi:hypothetical protein
MVSGREYSGFGELGVSTEFMRKFVQVYLNFGKLWGDWEESDSEEEDEEEEEEFEENEEEENSEELEENPSNPFRKNFKKGKKYQIMHFRKEVCHQLKKTCSFKKMFLFLNFKPKDTDCPFALEIMEDLTRAQGQIQQLFTLAFFNQEATISNF